MRIVLRKRVTEVAAYSVEKAYVGQLQRKCQNLTRFHNRCARENILLPTPHFGCIRGNGVVLYYIL